MNKTEAKIVRELEAAIKRRASAHRCHTGRDGRDIRCECGGRLAVSGTLHPLVDLGVGFVRGKFRVDRVYGKRVIGYKGFCLKCRKEGDFLLPSEPA